LRLAACERGRLGGGSGVVGVDGAGVLGRDVVSAGARFERTRMGGLAVGDVLKSIAEADRAGGGAELAPLA
jgi:hypothetical protein